MFPARADLLAAGLRGRRVGLGWIACCPAHDDRTPSLSIQTGTGGKLLVHCHAGCEQADVLAALRQRGLWGGESTSPVNMVHRGRIEQDRADDRASAAAQIDAAAQIWRKARDATNTHVERYLRERAITVPLPTDIRFIPELKHPDGSSWPAMVGLVRRGRDGAVLGVHRTFLRRDGCGKAPASPQKMMLGPCRGGAVRLAPAAAHLMIGEGIETCLSAMQARGAPAWAALSTSGLRTLDLPAHVTHVTVLADGDAAGLAAAESAAQRWLLEGRSVSIAKPPSGPRFQ